MNSSAQPTGSARGDGHHEHHDGGVGKKAALLNVKAARLFLFLFHALPAFLSGRMIRVQKQVVIIMLS